MKLKFAVTNWAPKFYPRVTKNCENCIAGHMWKFVQCHLFLKHNITEYGYYLLFLEYLVNCVKVFVNCIKLMKKAFELVYIFPWES